MYRAPNGPAIADAVHSATARAIARRPILSRRRNDIAPIEISAPITKAAPRSGRRRDRFRSSGLGPSERCAVVMPATSGRYACHFALLRRIMEYLSTLVRRNARRSPRHCPAPRRSDQVVKKCIARRQPTFARARPHRRSMETRRIGSAATALLGRNTESFDCSSEALALIIDAYRPVTRRVLRHGGRSLCGGSPCPAKRLWRLPDLR